MRKFLLAIQYWDGDRDSMMGLLELLCETVPNSNPWADLVIYCRFDSEMIPEALIKRLEQCFGVVWTSKSRTQVTGYPAGCNALWADLVMDSFRHSSEPNPDKAPWGGYKGVLAIEADTCPLTDDWLEVISKEWDAHDVVFMGAWDDRNWDYPFSHCLGHINGNAMFAMDLAKRVPSTSGCPAHTGWDVYHAPAFMQAGWQGTYAIRNLLRLETLPKIEFDALVKDHAVLLHGVKDNSVRELYLKSR